MARPKSDTRMRLLLTAMKLFAQKGYGSTSVSDILLESGCQSGSLYYFFPGKQDLLIGVLELYRDSINEMLLQPAWKGVRDPIERIFALLKFYRARLVESDCLYGCPIGSVALELHEPDLAVRQLLAENFTKWTDAVHACLADSRISGRNQDNEALAQFVLTTMEGAVMLARTHRDIRYFDRAVGQLSKYISFAKTEVADGSADNRYRRKSNPTPRPTAARNN